ncbi:MAG: hypothetical protein PHV32_14805 [Eubacteriales bacterium]|nr:hypothetical protein [Eubacteriales bacterium]
MSTNFNFYEYVMQNKIKYDEFRKLCLSEKLNEEYMRTLAKDNAKKSKVSTYIKQSMRNMFKLKSLLFKNHQQESVEE